MDVDDRVRADGVVHEAAQLRLVGTAVRSVSLSWWASSLGPQQLSLSKGSKSKRRGESKNCGATLVLLRRDSSRRSFANESPLPNKRRDESRRRRHECPRHVLLATH